jgi:hypothetical protein
MTNQRWTFDFNLFYGFVVITVDTFSSFSAHFIKAKVVISSHIKAVISQLSRSRQAFLFVQTSSKKLDLSLMNCPPTHDSKTLEKSSVEIR